MEEVNHISKKIIGLAIEVHRSLGPGLLESAYQECLYYELKNEGFRVEKEKPMPIDRKSTRLNSSHIPLSRMPSSA